MAAAENEPILYSTKYKTALGDGNCFFRAIYLSMFPRKDVLTVFEQVHPEIDTSTENAFVASFREYLSESISNDTLSVSDSYRGFNELYTTDSNSLGVAILDYPHYMRAPIHGLLKQKKKAPATPFFTFAQFKELLVKNIRIDKTLVSELEVGFVTELLAACSIQLKIFRYFSGETKIDPRNTEKQGNSGKEKAAKNIRRKMFLIPKALPMEDVDGFFLYIINIDDIHYDYIALRDPVLGGGKRRTRRHNGGSKHRTRKT